MPDLTPPPTRFNLADYVLTAGRATPDKTALVVAGSTQTALSFAELEARVSGLAAGLQALGLVPGTRILMRLGNELTFPICYLAALWGGFVPVPTSAALTAPEITKITDQLQPGLIMAGDQVPLPVPCPCPVLTSRTIAQMMQTPPVPPALGDPERLGYIIFTSGTSGKPRGILHAHRAIWARRMMWEGWYGLTPEDRLLHAGAFNWTYTLGTGLMDPWAIGATALIPEPGTAPAGLPDFLKAQKATIFAAAPGVYRQLLKQNQMFDLPHLRHGLSAGEAMPQHIRAAWQSATGTQVHEALGMSECSTFISGSPARPAPEGTAGYPQPGRRIRVLDQNDQGAGQLAIHRSDPGLMLGTLDASLSGDWFETGDMVSQDADGAIRYLGRSDEMLNAGGFRVSPLEIEQALCRHPEVTEAAAVAQEVKPGTFIITAHYSAAKPLSDAVLTAHCEAYLANYKRPRAFYHTAALPRAGNGKLNRKALRKGPA